jgi:hypothetical protein
LQLLIKKEKKTYYYSSKKKKVPLKATFFAWTVTLGKILTMDNLRKRVIVVD